MDFVSSVLGILLSTLYEVIFRENFLYSRLKPRKHKIYWFILILFRRNFKNYIKDLGLKPWKYPSIDDLKKARLTTKEDIKKYFPAKSTSLFLNFFSFKMSSSGSTGKPFEFNIFILQWIEEQARVYASFRLAGYQIGKKMVVFRSYSPKGDQKNIKEVKWKNWTYFNSFSLSEESLMEYYDYLIINEIKYLRTYPSTLATFLEFLKSKKLILKLRMIHVSSENISNKLIIDSEEYFECKLINYYGQVEQAVLGVNIFDNCTISILPYSNWYKLNDNTIASLNLINWANPLVNYQVQDHLLMIKDNQFNLIGRNNIYLNHHQGYLVSTINFYTLMQNFTTLIKWQIVQKSNLSIEMNFEGNISSEEKEQIRNGIEERLGNVLVKFNNNQFVFNGEGKINPIINNNDN